MELYTDGDMEKNAYLEMNDRLKKSVEQLNKKLSDLKEEQMKAANVGDMLDKVRNFFDSLSVDGGEALNVAREMLDSVTILEGSTQKEIKIKITMKYGNPFPAPFFVPSLCMEKRTY